MSEDIKVLKTHGTMFKNPEVSLKEFLAAKITESKKIYNKYPQVVTYRIKQMSMNLCRLSLYIHEYTINTKGNLLFTEIF